MNADASRPLGVLGGSFDPIHVGHVKLARAALRQLELERVLFVPAGLAWQKASATDGAHRARMVELAIAGEARFALDRRELQRPGPSYTVDTLRQLRAQSGPQRPLVLLMGADQFERLDTWHDWEQLIELAHLGVAPRPGTGAAELKPELTRLRRLHPGSAADLMRRPAGCVVDIAMAPVDCSSSTLRDRLRAGRPRDACANPMLTPAVLDYIRENRLYA